MSNAMTKCLRCGKGPVSTIDSRHDGTWRYRRKSCRNCGYRWATYEIPASMMNDLLDCHKQAIALRGALEKLDSMQGVAES